MPSRPLPSQVAAHMEGTTSGCTTQGPARPTQALPSCTKASPRCTTQLHDPHATVCCPYAPQHYQWCTVQVRYPNCIHGIQPTTCRLLRAERNCTPSISAARAAAVVRWGVGGLEGCGEAEEVAGLGREMLAWSGSVGSEALETLSIEF